MEIKYRANFPVAQSPMATKCEHVATNMCNAAGRLGDFISRRALAPLRLVRCPQPVGGARVAMVPAHGIIAKY